MTLVISQTPSFADTIDIVVYCNMSIRSLLLLTLKLDTKHSSRVKRETKKQLKHDAILKVSEDLMLKNGLHSLNMNDVAREANLAKGTLYLYFGSREEIIGALALKARIMLLNIFKQNIFGNKSSIEKLKGIVLANYTFLKQNKLYYELVSFYEIIERETETPEMQSVIKEITELIVSIIEQGKSKNEIKKSIDPAILSFSMWGMTVGIMQLIKSKSEAIRAHPGLTEDKIIEEYISVFISGIKK
ncbi:MAG: TetR/AcrR family transcriptional regulator [Bacteroidota bacterium]